MLTLVRKPFAVMLVPLWSPTNSPDSNPRSELIPSSNYRCPKGNERHRSSIHSHICVCICHFICQEPFPVISNAFLARLTPFGSIANSLLRHKSNHDRAREE